MKNLLKKISLTLTALALCLTFSQSLVFAADSENQQIQELNTKISEYQTQITTLQADIKERNDRLNELIAEYNNTTDESSREGELGSQIENTETYIEDANKNLTQLQQQLQDAQQQLTSATNNLEGGSLLPATALGSANCELVMYGVNLDSAGSRILVANRQTETLKINNVELSYNHNDILACAIKTGDIKFWMIPFYIRFILEFVIGIAGLIAVGFTVYGGYLYLVSGISEDKDAGKQAIRNGIIGLAVSLLAWAIVNVIVKILTSF